MYESNTVYTDTSLHYITSWCVRVYECIQRSILCGAVASNWFLWQPRSITDEQNVPENQQQQRNHNNNNNKHKIDRKCALGYRRVSVIGHKDDGAWKRRRAFCVCCKHDAVRMFGLLFDSCDRLSRCVCVCVCELRALVSQFRAFNQMENHGWPSWWDRWTYKVYTITNHIFHLNFFLIISFPLSLSLCVATHGIRHFVFIFLSSRFSLHGILHIYFVRSFFLSWLFIIDFYCCRRSVRTKNR